MKHWQKKGLLSCALLPLSALYFMVTNLHRCWYKSRFVKIKKWDVPIIIVGNITAGGTGKTPLVLWIVNFLKAQGYKPGIVSRGYKAQIKHYPQDVVADSNPQLMGDEPVLLARGAQCPVVISPNRIDAVARVIEHFGCDIVISDDGLQHYPLAGSVEIAVVDGQRQFGNGWYLPAGPLREGVARLKEMDLVVINQMEPILSQIDAVKPSEPIHQMQLLPKCWVNVFDPVKELPPESFSGKTVHAVAGIGNPGRFFATLRNLNITVIEHPFPDHHIYTANELMFNDELLIVMTEKDAVKCKNLNLPQSQLWYLRVEAKLTAEFAEKLSKKLVRRS